MTGPQSPQQPPRSARFSKEVDVSIQNLFVNQSKLGVGLDEIRDRTGRKEDGDVSMQLQWEFEKVACW